MQWRPRLRPSSRRRRSPPVEDVERALPTASHDRRRGRSLHPPRTEPRRPGRGCGARPAGDECSTATAPWCAGVGRVIVLERLGRRAQAATHGLGPAVQGGARCLEPAGPWVHVARNSPSSSSWPWVWLPAPREMFSSIKRAAQGVWLLRPRRLADPCTPSFSPSFTCTFAMAPPVSAMRSTAVSRGRARGNSAGDAPAPRHRPDPATNGARPWYGKRQGHVW